MNKVNFFENPLINNREEVSAQPHDSPIASAMAAVSIAGSLYERSSDVSAFAHEVHPARLPIDRQNVSLESQIPTAFQDIDIPQEMNFFDQYLSPNEGRPSSVQQHLDLIEEAGLLVSTGTERSFFDLCLCDPQKCHGLVVRDITHKAIAYVHFNTMLLRLSENRDEYSKLSSIPPFEEDEEFIKKRVDIIRNKLKTSDIPDHIKNYYLKNLEQFANVYFTTNQSWRSEFKRPIYQDVYYHENDLFFHRLQQYAKSGRIVATLGDINDLHFLDEMNIALVDISNIPNYCHIDLKMKEGSHPRVVWTEQDARKTTYYSYRHRLITDQQREEIKELLNVLTQSGAIDGQIYPGLALTNFFALEEMVGFFPEAGCFPPEQLSKAAFTEEMLIHLNQWKDRWMLQIPGAGWIHFNPLHLDHQRFRSLPLENLHSLLHHPDISRFVKRLVEFWNILTPENYLIFSEVEGWKEAFQRESEKQADNPHFQAFSAKLKKLSR